MTQYVLLSPDTTQIVTKFAGPQPQQIGYAELADNDPRYLAWQQEQANMMAIVGALKSGAQITSSSTPQVNGTYAIDPGAQQKIAAIAAGIASRARLPGGGTTFNYQDVNGAQHAFSQGNFLNFAAAIEDFVYALTNGTIPAQPVAIA